MSGSAHGIVDDNAFAVAAGSLLQQRESDPEIECRRKRNRGDVALIVSGNGFDSERQQMRPSA